MEWIVSFGTDHSLSTNVDYGDLRYAMEVYREHCACCRAPARNSAGWTSASSSGGSPPGV